MSDTKSKATEKVVEPVTKTFTAQLVNVNGTSGNGFGRESHEVRFARVQKIFAQGPVQIISKIGKDVATDLVNGDSYLFVDKEANLYRNPQVFKCVACGDTHGIPTAAMIECGEGWKAENLKETTIAEQDGKLLVFSKSCMANYVRPILTAQNCKNFAEVLGWFRKGAYGKTTWAAKK